MNVIAACRLLSSAPLIVRQNTFKPNCVFKKFLANCSNHRSLVKLSTGTTSNISATVSQSSTFSFAKAHQVRPVAFSFHTNYSTQAGDKPRPDEAAPPPLSPSWAEEDEEAKAQREKNKRRTRQGLYIMGAFFTGASLYGLFSWGKPQTDDAGNVIADEFSHLPWFKQYVFRAYDTIKNYKQVLEEPSRELLLPPPLEYPYQQPPYTLVMELNGVFLNPEWTYKTGWRFKKRPLIDYFLQQCGPPLFETVIFTEDTGFSAFPLIDALDPNGYIMHRLFRDSTRYEDGHRIKDLNCLNRDLKRVICIDWDKNACKLNPDNCLILKKWDGDVKDKTLFDLAQFLRTLAAQDVDDVREIIRHYSQFDDPLQAFLDYQRQVAELEEQKQAATKSSTLVSSFKRK